MALTIKSKNEPSRLNKYQKKYVAFLKKMTEYTADEEKSHRWQLEYGSRKEIDLSRELVRTKRNTLRKLLKINIENLTTEGQALNECLPLIEYLKIRCKFYCGHDCCKNDDASQGECHMSSEERAGSVRRDD